MRVLGIITLVLAAVVLLAVVVVGVRSVPDVRRYLKMRRM